jgi:hypothetical protein
MADHHNPYDEGCGPTEATNRALAILSVGHMLSS